MKKLLLLVLIFISGTSYLMAQSAVTGKVTDENGNGVPGANIIIKGTSSGTITDIDGNFSINTSSSNILIVTYVGYSTQEIVVGSQTDINVQLNEDIAALDEIVVTGYGTQLRKEITSAVTSLNEEDFNQGLNANPMGLLEGKVAGLSITKAGGDPNGGFTLRLRGISTVGANASPLVVINGVIGGNLDLVDPADIASIDVIKDGAAAAIYGTRGSSGVILVTTKKGNAGNTRVDYNVSSSVDQIARQPYVMTAAEYRNLPGATDLGTTTDWIDLVTRDGVSQVHNLAVSGGSSH
jgi:TonB-dependent SusC/RagA subfamily outer membrane receptor